ncbi:MAG: hypothetical protein FRX49_13656 [Trebouxia sp. A1-2]|nr:MAG: hypothetical protein FRX49_13656 [Trebouxia sp. A1-2]
MAVVKGDNAPLYTVACLTYFILQWGAMINTGGKGSAVSMYAHLAGDSQKLPIPKDLSDYWQDPSSCFLTPGVAPVAPLAGVHEASVKSEGTV